MWRAVRDAIKSDDATARFLKILAGLTMTLVIILAALAAAIWAVSDPVSTGALATAFRVVIGL
jgi:cation transport ATPase